jgi:hypothetical protein
LLFNFFYYVVLGMSKKTKGNWLGHISFWCVLIMLIYYAKNTYCKQKLGKSKESLLFSSEEVHHEVNTGKTKYSFMFCQQNIGKNYNTKYVSDFKYFGITLTNQNCMHEVNKIVFKSGNGCYQVVQILLS